MATLNAVIIDHVGTIQHTEVEDDLSAFQAVVGGYIEGVFGSEATIYVDEDGLMRRLPFNLIATVFANDILGHFGKQLFGTALILGPVADGRDTPVRPTVVEYFTKEN